MCERRRELLSIYLQGKAESMIEESFVRDADRVDDSSFENRLSMSKGGGTVVNRSPVVDRCEEPFGHPGPQRFFILRVASETVIGHTAPFLQVRSAP